MIKEENICHMYCIEKTRRRTKNENEVNILRQIYLVGEKKNREAKGERRKKRRKICFFWRRRRTEKGKGDNFWSRIIYFL